MHGVILWLSSWVLLLSLFLMVAEGLRVPRTHSSLAARIVLGRPVRLQCHGAGEEWAGNET